MLETITGFWLAEHLFEETYVPSRGQWGYKRVLSAERRPYPTKDGYVCAIVYNEKHWLKFVEKIGRPELLTDPLFATQAARSSNQVEIQAIIAAATPAHTTAEWLAFFEAADIPAMPAIDLADLPNDPHLKATGYFTEREHPTEGRIRTTASPFDYSATPTTFTRHAPHLGENGPEVLREAGFTAAEIDRLTACGAMKVAKTGT
jgi:formyl-CoA transferase